MLNEILGYLNNRFIVSVERSTFTLASNKITMASNYLVGQYIYIKDSVLNDGVYLIISKNDTEYTLQGDTLNEVFSGVILGMAIPKDLLALTQEISDYVAKQKHGVSSESIDDYSIAYSADSQNWTKVFGHRLSRYRKIFDGYGGDI
jgi:hypothetical protein